MTSDSIVNNIVNNISVNRPTTRSYKKYIDGIQFDSSKTVYVESIIVNLLREIISSRGKKKERCILTDKILNIIYHNKWVLKNTSPTFEQVVRDKLVELKSDEMYGKKADMWYENIFNK